MKHAPSANDNLIFGINPVKETLFHAPGRIVKVLFANPEKNPRLFELLKHCRSNRIPYQVTQPQKLKSMVRGSQSQGVIAVAAAKNYDSLEDILAHARSLGEEALLVLADSVEDPRNMGALVRTSVAAGVHGILFPAQGGVGITSTVAKASAGTVENMLFCRPKDIAKVLKDLSQKGFRIVGLDAQAETPFREAAYRGPLVLVTGGEHRGIRPHVRRCCTHLVSIPMRQKCHSLNLSVAAGILLYEVVKQRGNCDAR